MDRLLLGTRRATRFDVPRVTEDVKAYYAGFAERDLGSPGTCRGWPRGVRRHLRRAAQCLPPHAPVLDLGRFTEGYGLKLNEVASFFESHRFDQFPLLSAESSTVGLESALPELLADVFTINSAV